MAEIKDYVQVTVTRGTRPIDTAGFGTPLFLGLVNFYGSERVRIYSDTVSMTEDGFPTNHPAVVWATGVFGQTQRPNNVFIGKQTYVSYDATPTVVDSTDYTVEIGADGVTTQFTFTSGISATAAEIVDGLEGLITADANYTGKLVASNVADVLVITPAALNEVFVEDFTGNLLVVINTPEDVDVALAACQAENSNWFFLAGQSQTDTDILKFAAFAQANDKMYFGEAPVSTVGAVGTSDIASQLKALQYDNTQTVTVSDANLVQYASGALIGAMAATNPGTSVWFAKTLQGVSTDNFSGTAEANIESKNSNYYPLVAGVGFYTDGSQASGEFADTIRFSLWLKARIAESIFGLLKRKSDLGLKVPHTEEGYAMVKAAINEVITLGISRGAIATAEDGAEDPIIRTLPRASIPTNDRANRILPDVEVELTYTGAIQHVKVKVFVSV